MTKSHFSNPLFDFFFIVRVWVTALKFAWGKNHINLYYFILNMKSVQGLSDLQWVSPPISLLPLTVLWGIRLGSKFTGSVMKHRSTTAI